MLQKIELRPGINREGTDYSNTGGYYDCDKIRFRSGFPEKIGGWSRLSNNTYLGTARAMWNWVDLNGDNYLGVGTNKKYYIERGGQFYDITPISANSTNVGAAAGPFAAAIGSAVITITDGGYHPSVGDFIVNSGAASLGGNITAAVLNQEYEVLSTPSTTTYTISAKDPVTSLPVLATAGDTLRGGATVNIAYEVPIGSAVFTVGTGWGAGPYSRGTWSSGFTSGIGAQLRLWTNDNYGQDLVIAPRGGGIYYWQSSGTVATRAVLLDTLSTTNGFPGDYVPNKTNQILTSSIQRFVMAMGANPYISGSPNSAFNPMLVRWSDQNNPYQWVPAITNQSGEFMLTNGSIIMGARTTRQENLIWTDSALYSMQYLGAPYIWGFNILMDNISVMSPNAMITVNNITYWMGGDKFYMYSGRVETLPCSLKQYVFADINKDQSFQVFAGSNEGYNEIWWFYVSASSTGTAVDKYVIYNYVDRVWYYGTMARSAWLDSGIRQFPMAADYNNRVLYHESSIDDNAGSTPIAINAFVQSSDFDIGDGHNFGFIWRILPDVNFNGSTINNPAVAMTLKPRQNAGTPYGQADSPIVTSNDNYSLRNTYNIQQFTGQVYTRLRGRQISFRLESTGLGVSWQLGTPRLDTRADGKR